MRLKSNWWKYLGVLLVIYTLWAGLLFPVPSLVILHETIRNLYFHVTMWFSMIIVLTISVYQSIKYLGNSNVETDDIAHESSKVGIMFGMLGVSTGSLWANFTWGAWWVSDPKLNGAAVTLLFYFAYIVLRNSIDDPEKKARISAVYNIFSYVMLIVFLLILPRMTDSLHPGNGGNPGFNQYDLDSKMRAIFYPAILGWTLIGVWMMQMGVKLKKFERSIYSSTIY
jgi:heme exporter protein C